MTIDVFRCKRTHLNFNAYQPYLQGTGLASVHHTSGQTLSQYTSILATTTGIICVIDGGEVWSMPNRFVNWVIEQPDNILSLDFWKSLKRRSVISHFWNLRTRLHAFLFTNAFQCSVRFVVPPKVRSQQRVFPFVLLRNNSDLEERKKLVIALRK
jgi:hypothetical protein